MFEQLEPGQLYWKNDLLGHSLLLFSSRRVCGLAPGSDRPVLINCKRLLAMHHVYGKLLGLTHSLIAAVTEQV